ncbi:MAG TPA: right-handed parallel beta-helix repeat-containing protein, partial [Kofleriaceae bacterium]|nr:right-handed parallel beta-helix repeat-containing protein [Kofleriaceae bacterium]
TAITVTGIPTLNNVHVLTSMTAVQAEAAANVTANGLDIVGSAGACTMGIVLHGSAQLTATTLTSRNLGTTLTANDQSAASIGEANISGDRSCSQSLGLIMVTSSASFSIRNSLLDGGPNHGILLNPRSSLFQATLSTTIIKNMRLDGLGGGAPVGGSMSFQMNGGEISNNGNTGAELGDGTWAFTNVTIQHNSGLAIYLQGATLVMRGCMVTDNGSGIDVFDNAVADLGTATDPGNNVFHGTTSVGLTLDGSFGARLINAVGNTWNPSKQGADTNGRYPTPPSVVFAPINFADGNNYTLLGSWSLLR